MDLISVQPTRRAALNSLRTSANGLSVERIASRIAVPACPNPNFKVNARRFFRYLRFGHGVVGNRAGWFAGFVPTIGAMLGAGFLGVIMLAIVFLLGGRSLPPCGVAHFVINRFIEPGLALPATRGEMAVM